MSSFHTSAVFFFNFCSHSVSSFCGRLTASSLHPTVYTYQFLFENGDFFLRFGPPSARFQCKQSPKTHLLKKRPPVWRFCKQCFPVLVWVNENRGFWKIFRYRLSCQWMRMFPSRWVPFSVAIGFSCGRAKRIIKHKVWTRFFFGKG